RARGGRGPDVWAPPRPGRPAPAQSRVARLGVWPVREGGVIWAGVLVASASCYALKLAGLSLPQRWLQNQRVQRTVPMIPIALLAALVGTQTFSVGQHLVLDVRAAALVV